MDQIQVIKMEMLCTSKLVLVKMTIDQNTFIETPTSIAICRNNQKKIIT